ncbi:E3 binding domain-containing protein [Meiothermus rufus]|uniref:E3 binding domain-containing protein n=1 Tax=Meiothermus rufus TaxID=604332 RepID=UPI0004094C77|nr:E3 binding domain-containing protein [Meiothermus rufus]
MSETKITPLARRLAEENGINWRQIQGTGPDGTVVERDILAFLAKVMAGEVNLPPAPEEVPPASNTILDMTQAQAVLQKEGIQLGELLPSAPPEPPSTPGLPTLEDIEFDFEKLEASPAEVEGSPPVPPVDEAFEEAPSLAPEPSVVPNFDEPEPLVAPEPLPPLQWEEPRANPELAGLPPLPPESDLEAPSSPKLVWETQEVVPPSEEAPPPSPLEAGMTFSNTETVRAETPPAPKPEEAVLPAATPAPSAGLAETAPAQAQVLRVPVWQRLVSIGPAQEAAQTLSEGWRVEVGVYPLLYRAVDKALADTQTPLRPTKASLEGDQLKSLRVAPALSLRGTLDSLNLASEPGEGLAVLSLLDSPFDQVIFPGVPTLTLGRANGGQALLSLSGPMEAHLAGKLLERIAYYLERPILLA